MRTGTYPIMLMHMGNQQLDLLHVTLVDLVNIIFMTVLLWSFAIVVAGWATVNVSVGLTLHFTCFGSPSLGPLLIQSPVYQIPMMAQLLWFHCILGMTKNSGILY